MAKALRSLSMEVIFSNKFNDHQRFDKGGTCICDNTTAEVRLDGDFRMFF